ncbi:ABC transporter permease [Halolactibacillus alkaliphilus]|uniref:ABC transporter permease n=1 Tax=Halolactibacillus alkaliphilus TaxID=442899 RepID=A0A511X0K4_9BACI|nr:ABC transporter permease [Halolactibacillus alkaliphilus]GEN56476.1 ABC transporter permease [Halolactibacillus alkaliphilus]GGN64263.1 ABC transporter permease [Halolactibacillus alkaliphilus]SFO61518.1 simple sugar transport system permease protein [Halolactibacillus alkaliphilus]
MNAVAKHMKNRNILVPILATIIALVFGAIIMLIAGYNPVIAYQSLLNKVFGSAYDIGEVIRAIIPLLLSGFAVALANKAGLLNIGVDGQITIGAVASLLVGTLVDFPPIIHGFTALTVGVIAGGLWGVLIAYLKTRFTINEVISSIMLNYVALYLSHMLIRGIVPQEGSQRSALIQDSASISLNSLSELLNGARVHWGLFITPLIIFGFYYFFNKTRYGYETEVVGLNNHAAHYAGIKVNRIITRTMFISGAIGGLIGVFDTLGVYKYMAISTSTSGVGFDGVAIALLGGNTTIGTTLSGVLIGVLKYGSQGMQFGAGVPSEIIGMIISLIIFFVAAPGLVKKLLPNMEHTKKEVQ